MRGVSSLQPLESTTMGLVLAGSYGAATKFSKLKFSPKKLVVEGCLSKSNCSDVEVKEEGESVCICWERPCPLFVALARH